MVELLAPAAAGDDGLVGSVCSLINRSYAIGEAGLWKDDTPRMTVDDLAGFVGRGEIAVARRDGRVVGCVRVRVRAGDVGELGLLAVDPDVQGGGVGGALIAFAEAVNRARGVRELGLELLVPRAGAHPDKVKLDTWYQRLGYRPVSRAAFGDAYPDAARLLAVPCDLVTYRKNAGGGSPSTST
jgi:GNAT superfamily N-acetyltransferase